MKKILIPILLNILLFSTETSCAESAARPAIEEELSSEMVLADEKTALFVAQKAFVEYYYDVAARALSTFTEAFPASEEASLAYVLLGQARFHLKKYEEALATLGHAAKAKGGEKLSDAITFWTAKCELAQGANEPALEAFTGLAQKEPRSLYHLHSLYNIGLCHEAKGEYETALQQLQDVGKADEKGLLFFPCSLHEARCLMALGRTDEAQKLLLGSIEKKPNDPDAGEAFFFLGEIAVSLDDYESAMKYYHKSLGGGKLEGWHPEAYYGVGWCLLKLRKYDAALEAFENIGKLEPAEGLRKKVELSLCRLRLLRKENDLAIAALKEYIGRYPGDATIAEAQYLEAEALLNSNNWKAALQQYDEVISSLPNAPFLDRAYFGKGQSLFLSGNYLESVEAFRKAGELSKDPKLQLEAAKRTADTLYRAEDYAGAASTYRDVLEKSQGSSNLDEILFRVGWCYYRAEEYDSAIASLETLVTKFPKSEFADNALYRIGGAYCRKGDYEKALVEYEKLEKMFPASDLLDRVKYQTGLCNYNLGRYYVGLVSFRQVVEKFPKSPLAERCSYEMGWCHHQLGKEEDALKHFQGHIAKYGKTELSGEALFWIGEYHHNRDDYVMALESFRRLAEEYPQHKLADRALYWEGRSALSLEKYNDAVKAFSGLGEQFPKSSLTSDALYQLGVAYKGQGLFPEAVAAFRKVAEQHPKSYLRDEWTWQIADCLLAMGRKTEALSAYTELLRRSDPSARARGRYGRGKCFQAAGKYSAAIAELMVVIWEFPGEKQLVSESAFAAAKCYEELGQRQKAIRVYSLVVEGNLPGKNKAEESIQALRKRSLLFFIEQR